MDAADFIVERAGNVIAGELETFAKTIPAAEQADYFHPINRDHWVASFCAWLAAKQRRSAEVRASND